MGAESLGSVVTGSAASVVNRYIPNLLDSLYLATGKFRVILKVDRVGTDRVL